MLVLNNPIHHIGVATKSIELEFPIFQKLGFKLEDNFIDEKQGVRGFFITNGFYRLELLENLSSDGPLSNYLNNRVKMYHIAYESLDLQEDLFKLQSREEGGGGIIIKPIMQATYFKRLCFIMMRNQLLIELVEK